MAKCAHCGEGGAETTTVEVSRLLRTSKLKVDLCRDCHAALVDFIEHGEPEAEEPEEDEQDEEEEEDEEDED